MITSVYPVLVSDDVARTADFFCEHFEFKVVFATEWYVSLRACEQELAVLDVGHPTVPDGHDVTARGVLVNIEVDDVDALAHRLVLAQVPVVRELRTEEFGQRHVIVLAPGNVLVDVIQPIAFTGAYDESGWRDRAASTVA